MRYLDLTDTEARALAIADNRLGELADWDGALLDETLRAIQEEDAALLAVTGWADEMDSLFEEEDDADMDKAMSLEYRVVVDVRDERAQAELIRRLELEGLSCQALIS